MTWFLSVTIVLYTLGLLHSIFGFYQKRRVFQQLAMGMVATGFLSHTIFLLWMGFHAGHFPLTNLSESLCFFAWCISLAFMIANIRYKVTALGAFSLPLVSVLTILSQFMWEENHAIPPLLKSGWVSFHAGVAFLSYAAFFLTFVLGVFYLIQ
jgi:ABC-type transport system involved in cytochrome c biogenesis permease subunit